MELIDKKKIYRGIKQVEQKYHRLCCDDMEMSTYRIYQRFIADLANIRLFIENEEADIAINDKLFKEPEEHKCIQCGRPVDLPYSICKGCQDEGAQQRDEYVQHCVEEASKNETCS